MKTQNYNIDSRTREDLIREIAALAKSYVPEWSFDTDNPDIGSVLALIFADQTEGNIMRLNQVLERYHISFVNLLDISLRPAHPASATVLMSLMSENAPDIYVEKATRFLAPYEDNNLVFESEYPVFLTASRLSDAFMTSEKEGIVLPVKGEFNKPDYIGRQNKKDVADIEPESDEFIPFGFLNFPSKGIEKNALVMLHSRIFDIENEDIFCKIDCEPEFIKKLATGEYRFLYYTNGDFKQVEKLSIREDKLILCKSEPGDHIEYKGREYGVLIIEALKPQTESVAFNNISFSSSGRHREPDFVNGGNNDYDVKRFNIFSDTLSPYTECYVGLDSYFVKGGSKISVSMNIGYAEHYIGYGRNTEDKTELKVIKRKPKYVPEAELVYSYADEITIEYFNGIGWKRLNVDQDYANIFAEGAPGLMELTFMCPDDWQETTVGAYQGRALKFTLKKADNCFLPQVVHRYPVISDLTVAYSYEDKYIAPEYATAFHGTAAVDVTSKLASGEKFMAFEPSNYPDTALYLGFTRPFENGPVSLWWQFEDIVISSDRKLHYYYSSPTGFKEMKVIDYTAGFTRTGIMMFLPPEDMITAELEGKKLCWIKITDDAEASSDNSATIRRIATNAVQVRNILTHDPEDYYMDSVSSNMVFPLHAEDILDVDIWVNEVTELSQDMMQHLMTENPDRVKVVYNYLGNIAEFYVKWTEKDNFNNSKAGDRHFVVDRINNLVIFGDGVHARIPRCTTGVAFSVQVRSCNGSLGNVEAGMITESARNLMYVQDIINPCPAYGGSDMESMERALLRGANLLSSGGRFVTARDYLDEITNYSETIDKASIVVGTDRFGNRHDSMLYVVLLMKDFANGSTSFYQMQAELRKHLLEHCELTVCAEELIIEEPVFVELDVDVWAQIVRIEDSFEIQTLVKNTLNDYLNPVTYDRHKGWNIGEMPRRSQIMMKLNSLKSKAIIKQLLVTARYRDRYGVHEMDLDKLKTTPFMVVTNGNHRVHTVKTED